MSSDERAEQIIRMVDDERRKANNFMNLYQQYADIGYPVENQITTQQTPGKDKSLDVRDPTAIFALEKAASGFIGAWIPRERFFFGIRVKNRRIAELDHVKRWSALAVQIAHDEIFNSNFMMSLHPTVKSAMGFGTGNMLVEWDKKNWCLNYKDWHISQYTFKQDSHGMPNACFYGYELTARQAAEEFTNPGEEVVKAANEIKDESKLFAFIHVIRRRLDRNVRLVNNLSMPYESLIVNVKEKKVIEEGGYEEFPCAIPRWERASCEKWGRGRGLAMLSAIKELQQMRKDFIECGNRYNHPPYEVIATNVEGEVNVSPNGRTDVLERNSINPLAGGNLSGNFPITKDMIAAQQDLIKEGFYVDIFSQFSSLKGDRRVQLELELRYKEGLRQLISPVSRQEAELFTPILTRTILLLIRYGSIPPPPPELRDEQFGIEYMGELAMAIRDMQARGFERAVATMGNVAGVFPAIRDYMEIVVEKAASDVLTNYGVKVEHLPTPEELAAKAQQRQREIAEEKALVAVQAGAKAYKEAGKKPEDGSASAQLQEALAG